VSHLDPELLALIALGEPVASADEHEHLASCRHCTAEVAELSHAVVIARSTMDEAELERPPARVWERIADELALSSATARSLPHAHDESPLGATHTDLPTVAHSDSATGIESPGDMTVDAPSARAAVEAPAEPRRRRRSMGVLWALAASVALMLVVGAGVWVGVGRLTATPIATAALEAFPSHPEATGTAEVEEARNGTRTLTVTLEGDVEAEEYREVWLIRNDGTALISVGVLQGASGSFPIPNGVDLSEYDLVDISFEPLDGDPAHSGDSIVRGQLEFA
jgi:hypothetical protein